MNNTSLLYRNSNSTAKITVLLLITLPLTVFSAGGGGGGGGGGSGPAVTINGIQVAVDSGLITSRVSNVRSIDNIWSGNFSGTNVSFNKSSGKWEGNESHDGGTSLGTNTTCTNCGTSPIIPSSYIISQTCVNSSQVDVLFRPPRRSSLYGRDGNDFLGSFRNGEAKSIRLSAGASYPNAMWFWSYTDNSGNYRNQESHFSFNVRNDCAPPPPTVDLNANPAQVNYKETSTLTWTSQNTVGSCVATGGWSGNKVANNMIGETTQPLTAATTFYLTCSGQTGTTPARDQQTVQVIYGEGGDIKVNDDDKATVYKDDEVKISWDVGTSAPENCVIKAGEIVIKTLNSGEEVGDLIRSVIGETVFTLDCEDGNNIDSATVKVLPEFQET